MVFVPPEAEILPGIVVLDGGARKSRWKRSHRRRSVSQGHFLQKKVRLWR
jgi:hypothetical protein